MGLVNWIKDKFGGKGEIIAETAQEKKSILRDMASLKAARKFHPKGKRPVWGGPVPDRYYYAVKNQKHPTMAAYIVRFTDDPLYEPYVRQIACKHGGDWSLVESDVPLPEDAECVKRAHGKVDNIKKILHESSPQKTKVILSAVGERIQMPGKPPKEEEVFG